MENGQLLFGLYLLWGDIKADFQKRDGLEKLNHLGSVGQDLVSASKP